MSPEMPRRAGMPAEPERRQAGDPMEQRNPVLRGFGAPGREAVSFRILAEKVEGKGDIGAQLVGIVLAQRPVDGGIAEQAACEIGPFVLQMLFDDPGIDRAHRSRRFPQGLGDEQRRRLADPRVVLGRRRQRAGRAALERQARHLVCARMVAICLEPGPQFLIGRDIVVRDDIAP